MRMRTLFGRRLDFREPSSGGRGRAPVLRPHHLRLRRNMVDDSLLFFDLSPVFGLISAFLMAFSSLAVRPLHPRNTHRHRNIPHHHRSTHRHTLRPPHHR